MNNNNNNINDIVIIVIKTSWLRERSGWKKKRSTLVRIDRYCNIVTRLAAVSTEKRNVTRISSARNVTVWSAADRIANRRDRWLALRFFLSSFLASVIFVRRKILVETVTLVTPTILTYNATRRPAVDNDLYGLYDLYWASWFSQSCGTVKRVRGKNVLRKCRTALWLDEYLVILVLMCVETIQCTVYYCN